MNVELIESRETDNLMKDEKAFLLFLKIGYKTAGADVFDVPPVRVGWAFIKGADDVNMTVQEYRSAKRRLENWGFVKFENSNKGTYAQITTDKFIRLR